MKNKLIIPLILFITLLSVFSSCKKEDAGDGTVPEIVVLGLNPLYWALDVPYVDAGAVAFDFTSEGDTLNITNKIVVTNNVDVSAVGNYDVVYNVTDDSGVAAEQKTRNVTIVIGK